MESPELILDEFLPREMKDIFFTNGDAAMVFISSRSGRAGKREQVKEAIRALLGIGMLELAQDHLTRVKVDSQSRLRQGFECRSCSSGTLPPGG